MLELFVVVQIVGVIRILRRTLTIRASTLISIAESFGSRLDRRTQGFHVRFKGKVSSQWLGIQFHGGLGSMV